MVRVLERCQRDALECRLCERQIAVEDRQLAFLRLTPLLNRIIKKFIGHDAVLFVLPPGSGLHN